MSQVSDHPLLTSEAYDRLVQRLPGTTAHPDFCLIGIDDLLNNRATTGVDDLDTGRLNAWGNSFPSRELPEPGAVIEIAGIPFVWPNAHTTGDNVRSEGQVIDIPSGRYDWIYLLAASERRSEDTLWVHYEDGHADPLRVGVSDFLDGTPAFGELPAFRTAQMHSRTTSRRTCRPRCGWPGSGCPAAGGPRPCGCHGWWPCTSSPSRW